MRWPVGIKAGSLAEVKHNECSEKHGEKEKCEQTEEARQQTQKNMALIYF